LLWEQDVAGSNPAAPTNLNKLFRDVGRHALAAFNVFTNNLSFWGLVALTRDFLAG
jgi:hypothetical protein